MATDSKIPPTQDEWTPLIPSDSPPPDPLMDRILNFLRSGGDPVELSPRDHRVLLKPESESTSEEFNEMDQRWRKKYHMTPQHPTAEDVFGKIKQP